MPGYCGIREEELKNKVAQDWFAAYDCTQIIGNIDFCVAVPVGDGPQLFETESLLWAEAKAGSKRDIWESFVQLILTIGRARTFDGHLPPAYLGAFDAQRIAFLPYESVIDVFYQNDFNWNVTPSDHDSKEFRQLYAIVSDTLKSGAVTFRYEADAKELRHFIKQNFIVGKSRQTKVRITKTNFTAIYRKWREAVMPSIAIDWDAAHKEGIIDADFFLADLLSKDNLSLREKLFVLLRNDHYYYNRQRKATGAISFDMVDFNDQQQAHHEFWQRYSRPPRREYWDFMVNRRDLLVPQDIRERKGSYFTPQPWVELSQQYLAAELGEDWQEEYDIWDCAAGTGNLLAGLTNKHHIWASTLDKADVDVMHDRIRNGANLLERHVFQFDFLNDPFTKLPQELQDIINDPERRKKLVVYINPPYVEASNARTNVGTGENRSGVSSSLIREKYIRELGRAANELFAQFYVRIYSEIPSAVLAIFSTLKILQGPNFRDFRKTFPAKLGRLFLVPADTFDNVTGQFPIGFHIWHFDKNDEFEEIDGDVYDIQAKEPVLIGKKTVSAYKSNKYIIEWIRNYYNKENEHYAYLRFLGTDFQNNNGVFVTLKPSDNDLKQVKGNWVTPNNIVPFCIYFSVRLCIPADWLNDRDQFLYPIDGWQSDREFQSDCLVYTLFHGQNRISSMHGVNHWIPFTESEVDAQEVFQSHFMSQFIAGKVKKPVTNQGVIFQTDEDAVIDGTTPICFSPSAQAVLDAGRELWRYYHQQPDANPNASLYDIRLHFQGTKVTAKGKEQMNPDSPDETYTQLIGTLRSRLKELAKAIQPKVYTYGFLIK
ncbi:MAG: hypothetical protein IJ845_11480 [Bacteroidaceae bacterium]|nr:hypothetical protein [Bacteroidaceae bacterium]